MQKRGQLGIIEFKYFMIGVIIGLVIGIILVYLSIKGIIPLSLKSTFCGVAGK